MFNNRLKLFSSYVKSFFYVVPESINYRYLKESPEWAYPKILGKIFKKNCGYNLNLFSPKTFNEKIQYLKLFDNSPLKTLLSDKLAVRDYIKDKIDSKHIKTVYGVYNSFDEIDLDKLPESFYLKTNHGCKMIKLIESKDYFLKNKDELKTLFDRWLNVNYAYAGSLELQYRDIAPKIFAEKVISHPECLIPMEVEIYCFNGVPKCTFLRKIVQEPSCGTCLYSVEEGLLPYSFTNKNKFNNIPFIPLPRFYEEMLEISKKLSKGFKFVRVDFSYTLDNFYFAEMTFSPFSGFFPMPDVELDKLLSKWLVL